ncbi:hypothetical protein PAV_5c01300 [Paenibacillus alvei DSM 29]|nr:hypothetical protein PAV_5c01300 [Paenibacillus alvei DSM 29]
MGQDSLAEYRENRLRRSCITVFLYHRIGGEGLRSCEIRQGVMRRVREYFPDIPVLEAEERTDEQAPCLVVKLVRGERTRVGERRFQARAAFEVDYYPDGKASVHDVADGLYDALELIEAGGGLCRGTGLKHEIVERKLRFQVQYEYMLARSREEASKMNAMKQEGRIRDV